MTRDWYPGQPTREDIDRRLREHAGDNTEKIIGWVRSSVLSDDDAGDVLYRLDQAKRRVDLQARMTFSASGTIEGAS